MLTQMDYLVVENHLLSKADQQPWDKLHGLTERVRARVKDTVNRELDPKALRDFGLQFAAFFSVIFGLLLPWAANLNYPLWTWVVGLAITAWALTAPETLRVLHTGWMRLAVPLNRITSPILMGLIYFAIFTPVAACRKLLRRYLPDKSEETNTTTYRIDAGENDIRAKLENPY